MSSENSRDLLAFRHFLDEQIENGCADLSPRESLELWQARQRETNECVAALETA